MVLGRFRLGILAENLANIRSTFPMVTAVRNYRERPEYVRRYGYNIEWYINGPFPRLKPTPDLKRLTTKPFKQVNRWNAKRALFGQNDYIDILGDGTVHPRDLLTGPYWLRGFKGIEMQRLIRKRDAVYHYLPDTRPTQWNMLQKRLRYLWKYHNFRQNHKDHQLGRCE